MSYKRHFIYLGEFKMKNKLGTASQSCSTDTSAIVRFLNGNKNGIEYDM